MTMLTQIFAAIQEYAWRIIWVGSVLTALEVLVPQVRYSIITRLRSLAFWSVYVLITVSALTIFNTMWATLGVRPWIVLHIGDWFNYPHFRAFGLVAAPILAAILTEFFYYWFHRMQHAVPFFWRFHSVHHSLQEMSAWNCNHHFTEEIFRIPFVTLPLSLLISSDPGPVPLVIGSIIAMQPFYEHSCIRCGLGPVRYIIADNKYHRIHHSIEPEHLGKNFGSRRPAQRDVEKGVAEIGPFGAILAAEGRMIGVGRGDNQAIRVSEPRYEHAGIAGRYDNGPISHVRRIKHVSKARRRKRFSPPSGHDGQTIGRPMRRENDKENVIRVIYVFCGRLQRRGKRGGRGVASLFAVKFDDGRVGA